MLKRLADAHPNKVAQLTLQYRMNEAICSLCNEVAYKGKLRCANNNVTNGKLQLDGFPAALAKIKVDWKPGSGVGWLLQVINPNKGVIFVDTDPLVRKTDCSEASWLELSRGNGADGGNLINSAETILSRTIIHGLLACGLNVDMIGLISPYRSQVRKTAYFMFTMV
jgi:DNA replication ATP-dependent helicase Dna2